MRPRFVKYDKLWITAIGIVLLKAEDNTEAATLKARGYLSRHLNEKKVAKLIKKAFRRLKPMRQRSESPSWKQQLAEAGLRGVVGAVVSEAIKATLGLL